MNTDTVMRILTLLDQHALKRLRASISRGATMRPTSIAEIGSLFDDMGPTIVVADPSQFRPEAFAAVVEQTAEAGNAALVLYTVITPESVRAVIAASQILPTEVVFHGAPDESACLERVCEGALVASVSALILRGLSSNLARMRASAAGPVVALFGATLIPDSAAGLLARFDASPDTVRDWFTAAGLSTPHRLRWCALLARALPELKERAGHTLEWIVERWALGSVRAFRRECNGTTGCSPLRVRTVSDCELAKRLVGSVVTPAL
jgi:AraC-like DNA-binding protein